MKKFIMASMLVAASAFGASAQSVFNNPDNKAYLGIRVAGDITCPGKVSYEGVSSKWFKNGGGIEFGAIYNIPVVANFYVEPGLKLFYDKYSLDDILIADDDDYSGLNKFDWTLKKFGMRIPVMFGYHFDFTDDIKVSLFTGPELEVGFSARAKMSDYEGEVSGSAYGDEGFLKRVNVLWGIGAGVSYQNFYLGVNGGIGMVNMLSDSDGVKFHENRVSISLGYNF